MPWHTFQFFRLLYQPWGLKLWYVHYPLFEWVSFYKTLLVFWCILLLCDISVRVIFFYIQVTVTLYIILCVLVLLFLFLNICLITLFLSVWKIFALYAHLFEHLFLVLVVSVYMIILWSCYQQIYCYCLFLLCSYSFWYIRRRK